MTGLSQLVSEHAQRRAAARPDLTAPRKLVAIAERLAKRQVGVQQRRNARFLLGCGGNNCYKTTPGSKRTRNQVDSVRSLLQRVVPLHEATLRQFTGAQHAWKQSSAEKSFQWGVSSATATPSCLPRTTTELPWRRASKTASPESLRAISTNAD